MHQEGEMMLSNISVDQGQFTALAMLGGNRDASDDNGLVVARACMLEELIGAVFGWFTVWYLVSSLAALV
jgi:hypothetical protein